jgi:hypothetical protein
LIMTITRTNKMATTKKKPKTIAASCVEDFSEV